MTKAPKAHGAIFHAKEKKNDNQPDARGTVNITPEFIEWLNKAPRDGYGNVVADIAAWKKRGPRAGEYLSLSMSEPMGKGGRDTTTTTHSRRDESDVDDEIPF